MLNFRNRYVKLHNITQTKEAIYNVCMPRNCNQKTPGMTARTPAYGGKLRRIYRRIKTTSAEYRRMSLAVCFDSGWIFEGLFYDVFSVADSMRFLLIGDYHY